MSKIGRVNQFGDSEDVSEMSADDWEHRWQLGQTQFHMDRVNSVIETYYNRLTNNRNNLRIYVPLCGKSVDMKWLLDKGHQIVGCDAADIGCREFFTENNIPYIRHDKIDTFKNGCLYKSKEDDSVSLYKGDVFTLPSEVLGQFDCVWDRGSFVAIPVTRRQEYVDLILPTLKRDGRYLLDTFQLTSRTFLGPPFNCSEEDMQMYFGSRCNIELLESNDILSSGHREHWGLDTFNETVYLLTLK